MTRSRFAPAAVLLCLCLVRPAAGAQDLPDATAQWARALVQCLAAFQSCFDDIADEAERENLMDRLSELNADLFRLEKSKEFFVISLERQRLRPEELRASAEHIQRDIEEARTAFGRLGAFLRGSGSEAAADAERVLGEALLQRKLFIEDLLRALEAGEAVDTTEMAEAGRSAVLALREAQDELNEVLAALEEE